MISTFEWFFNLRPGDLRHGIFLALYYFLTISAYTEGQIVRDALFLGHFQAVQLPYVDFGVAAMIGAILALYIRIARRTSLTNLLVGTLLVFLSNVLSFWWIERFRPAEWLYPVVYIWVGIFGVLAVTQVWTLANYVLTGREAKRLFGFIGSGGILGGIFGGFFSNFLARSLGTESLLLAMAVSIGISISLVFAIRAQSGDMVQALSETAVAEESPGTLVESFRLVCSSPHLLKIAALICVCSVVTALASWQFRAIAKEFLVDKDTMAVFFGSFYGYTGALALVAQVLLTPRLLRYFGVSVALLILPFAFAAGSIVLIISGTLWAASLLKGTDRVVRYSIDTAALQLLYVPISAETKLQAKSFLDTVVLRTGDGLAAVLVLLLAGVLGLTAGEIGWISLGLLVLWIVVARKAGHQYVATLEQTLRERRLDAERLTDTALDRSATQMMITELRSNDPSKILYVLGLLEGGRWKATYSSIRNLLDHPVPEVRAKAISVFRSLGNVTVAPRVEQLMRDPNLSVRTEALLFLAQHTNIDPLSRIQDLGDFEDFSISAATAAFLGRSENGNGHEAARLILEGMINERGPSGSRARLESAKLIHLLPSSFAMYLSRLLEDEDPEVLRESVRTAAIHKKRQFVPPLITLLGNPEVRAVASEALLQFGENIQGSLGDHLSDPEVSLDVKREIPELLVAVAKRNARDPLMANLLQNDSILRFRIISSLNKLNELYPDLELDAQTIEVVLASELMSHYRSYQIMNTMDGHLDKESFRVPLQKSIQNELERIFRLLKMLYPHQDLESAFVGLQSGQKNEHDFALEFIENTVKPPIRRLVVPLVDAEIGLPERVELANRILHSKIESKDDALQVLVETSDPWLKSCAAHVIGIRGLKQFQKEVDEWATDPDPLLREKAQKAQQRLAAYA
jgi:ATP:ADP antiporter, AAA family